MGRWTLRVGVAFEALHETFNGKKCFERPVYLHLDVELGPLVAIVPSYVRPHVPFDTVGPLRRRGWVALLVLRCATLIVFLLGRASSTKRTPSWRELSRFRREPLARTTRTLLKSSAAERWSCKHRYGSRLSRGTFAVRSRALRCLSQYPANIGISVCKGAINARDDC